VIISTKKITRHCKNEQTKKQWEVFIQSKIDIARRDFEEGFRAVSIREGLPDYIKSMNRRNLKKETIRTRQYVLLGFADDMASMKITGLIGDVYLFQITYKLMEKWADKRLIDISVGTFNRDVGIIKGFARWAINSNRWPVDSKSVQWMNFGAIKHKPKKPDILTDSEIEMVMRAMTPNVEVLLRVMALTVHRPSALCNLRWCDIDFPNVKNQYKGWMESYEPKTKESLGSVVRNAGLLHCWLIVARNIFEDYRRRAPRSWEPVFITRWARANRGLGGGWVVDSLDNTIRQRIKASSLPERIKSFTPYSIRHSVLMLCARSGASSHDRRLMAGHASEATQKHYTDRSGEDRREGQEFVEKRLGRTFKKGLDRFRDQAVGGG